MTRKNNSRKGGATVRSAYFCTNSTRTENNVKQPKTVNKELSLDTNRNSALGFVLFLFLCAYSGISLAQDVEVGAARFDQYEPYLRGKRVALVCNHTSRVGQRMLYDTLRERGINLVRLFTPEHGLDGVADAGERVKSMGGNGALPEVVSLYDHNKRLPLERLKGVEVVLFDLQDVGVRCYTYISTMHYVMEACASAGVPLVVLDRPNPNGHFVDGPMLQPQYKSFVGMHPVPWVHGMTVGEYARMLIGEQWIDNAARLSLRVVPCASYTHTTHYAPPVPPSPNLPNLLAILLYPSLAFFEGTNQSVGRGTDLPFQIVGSPKNTAEGFSFIPEARKGAKNPPYKGDTCYGINLSCEPIDSFYTNPHIRLSYLQTMRKRTRGRFFIKFFDQLAGTTALRLALEEQKSESRIRNDWKPDLERFKAIRKKYLLYPDFE